MLSWLSKYLRAKPTATGSSVEAFMDVQSLCAHYDCDFTAVATQDVSSGTRLTDIERAFLHERLHVCQIASTSFGYYYQLLRDAQAATAYNALRKLREMAPTRIIPPLMLLLDDAEIAEMQDGPLPYIKNFLNTELLALLMLGDGVTYLERTIRYSVESPLKQQFLLAEELLALYLNWSKRLTLDYRPQTDDPALEWPDERQLFFMIASTTGDGGHGMGGYNVRHVLESSAKVAEYWNGDRPERGSFVPLDWKQEIQRHQQMLRHEEDAFWGYWLMIKQAEGCISASNCNEFVYTFLAIADFALCPPILPFQTELRRTAVTFHELHPLSRFFKLLRAAPTLDPICVPANDYPRFVKELSAKSGLISPLELARHSHHFASCVRRDDLASYAYFASQSMRLEMPEIFLNLEVFFLPRQELLFGPMQSLFYHPVISFRDRTFYGLQQEATKYHIMRFLLNSYARQLMYEESVEIVLPFQENDPNTIDFFRRELTEALRARAVTPIEFTIRGLEAE